MKFSDRDWNMHHIPTSQPLKPLPGYDDWLIEPKKPEDAQVCSRVLINATRKFPFPPVALPKKEYMEQARTIWEELGLPELTPREPWYGYTMGLWPDDLDEEAQLAAASEYGRLEEKLKNTRVTVGEKDTLKSLRAQWGATHSGRSE